MTIDRNTRRRLRNLARRIADDMFTTGFGKATRLRAFANNERYLGAWSQQAVFNRVFDALIDAEKRKRSNVRWVPCPPRTVIEAVRDDVDEDLLGN